MKIVKTIDELTKDDRLELIEKVFEIATILDIEFKNRNFCDTYEEVIGFLDQFCFLYGKIFGEMNNG